LDYGGGCHFEGLSKHSQDHAGNQLRVDSPDLGGRTWSFLHEILCRHVLVFRHRWHRVQARQLIIDDQLMGFRPVESTAGAMQAIRVD
jgi:hypothetical protein